MVQLIRGDMLYSVVCQEEIVFPDERSVPDQADMCYIYMPVWRGNPGNTLPSDRRFLIPGSRLLSNNSEVELCKQNLVTARRYESLDGRWVTIALKLILLVTPRKIMFDQDEDDVDEDTDEEDASGGLYIILQYANWSRAWEWPLYHKSLRAWVNFREGNCSPR